MRVHPRRGLPPDLVLAPVPWSPIGRFTADDVDPGDLLAYHTGTLYPQDAASQVPVLLLAPQPGETVVDLCAAPGSKTTQIGLALGDDGLLVACDNSPPRRRILAENLARQGVACAVVTPLPVHRLCDRLPESADAVLVDAPCSGHSEKSPRQVARMALRQGELLHQAARLVRPGGRLVYSTCTAYEGENEGVIQEFLATEPEWQVAPRTLPGTSPDHAGLGGIRLSPAEQGTEPFFAILLVRAGAASGSGAFLGTAPEPAVLPWLPTAPAWQRGGTWFIGSPAAAACALPTEARGLIVGHGDRLEPWGAQALIERGAPTVTVTHASAVRLWAGDELADALAADALVATTEGLPLGQLSGDGRRLVLPSRLRRPRLR